MVGRRPPKVTARRPPSEAPIPDRGYMKLARQYERDVISGKIPVCKTVRQAIERNVRDRARQRTPDFPYYHDSKAAVRVCYVKEQFSHIKGPKAKRVRGPDGELTWQRIILEPWQIWYWTTLFGWKRVSDGMRRFRIALYSVPRKNAKSTDAATTSLYMVSADNEGGGECFNLATKKEQARIIWTLSAAMAKRCPEFREHFGVSVGAHAITVAETESFLVPLSSDAHSLDGLNTHFATLDELHAHRQRDLYDVVETSTGSRDQPLLLLTTTAGVNMAGICYELLTYLRKILSGVASDDTFFGVDYTIDEEDRDQWDTERVWRKANPNYGVSVMPDDLRRLANKARVSPASRNNFLKYRLNVWVKAEADTNLLPAWQQCADPTLKLDQFLGCSGYVGIDLAEVSDIAAKILLFPREDGRFVVFGKYYLPESAIENAGTIDLYPGWVHDEWIETTDGNVIDYLAIEDDIAEDVDRFAIEEVCFDRALAGRMLQNLRRRLGEDVPITTVQQDWPTLSLVWEVFETLVRGGKIAHNGDPVLTWMVSNVVLKQNDRDEKFPVKAGGKLSKQKIDGVMALLDALVCATSVEDADDDETSVHNERVRAGQPPLHIAG